MSRALLNRLRRPSRTLALAVFLLLGTILVVLNMPPTDRNSSPGPPTLDARDIAADQGAEAPSPGRGPIIVSARRRIVAFFPKTWWSGGSNSRMPPWGSLERAPGSDEAQGVVLRWSERAARRVADMWAKVQRVDLTGHEDWLGADVSALQDNGRFGHPTSCHFSESDRFVELPCVSYGLMSEIRDLTTIFLLNTLHNTTVVPRPDLHAKCRQYCNLEDVRGTDHHLSCFFRPVSGCRGPYGPGKPSKLDNTLDWNVPTSNYGVTGPSFWDDWVNSGDVWWESIEGGLVGTGAMRGITEGVVSGERDLRAAAALASYGVGGDDKGEPGIVQSDDMVPPPAPPAYVIPMNGTRVLFSQLEPPRVVVPRRQLQYLTQLAMLRSITATMIFRPKPLLVAMARELEIALGLDGGGSSSGVHAGAGAAANSSLPPIVINAKGPRKETRHRGRSTRHHSPAHFHPMLVVHIRRTDKITDAGVAEETRKKFPNNKVPVEHYGRMAAVLEKRAGVKFRSVLLLSDDMDVWRDKQQLVRHLHRGEGVRVLMNPMWHMFGPMLDTAGWRQWGHNVFLTMDDKRIIYRYHQELIVDMLVAGRHGDYLLGCGSSGVSQYIAQLIGGRLRMDPEWVTLWEEDILTAWDNEEKMKMNRTKGGG